MRVPFGCLVGIAAAVAAVGCRDRPRDDHAPTAPGPATAASSTALADAAVPDTLGALLADLEDASGDVFVPGVDVTIVAVKVTPPFALVDAKDALATQRWRFRSCAGLAADAGPSVQQVDGLTTTVTFRVGEGGDALGADAGSDALGQCLARAAQAVTFSQPDGGRAGVEITLRWRKRP